MFTPEQKRFVYENSVKVNDNNKYIEIMGYYSDYFSKAKVTSIKRKIIFIFLLLAIVYMVARYFLNQSLEGMQLLFRAAAIFVGALIVLKLGYVFLNYIDDLKIVKRIQNKECDMLIMKAI